jgi:xanthine dehydrogenase iron-sulfur cluster and FAD-binding subunit A
MLVTAKALLDQTDSPRRDQIVEALSGNLCRCTGYVKIFEAVELAAERMRASAGVLSETVLSETVPRETVPHEKVPGEKVPGETVA